MPFAAPGQAIVTRGSRRVVSGYVGGGGVAPVLPKAFAALNQYSRVSPDASTADFTLPTDFIDYRIEINLPTWAGHHISSRWGDPFGVSTCSLYLNVGTDGKMNVYKLDSAGNFAQATSGVDLRPILEKRTWATLRWRLNSSAGTILGIPSGIGEFGYSLPAAPNDFIVLDTASGLGTSGFNQYASKAFNIGTFAGNNDMIAGRVRRCSLTDKNGVALFNPDFTTLAVGKPSTSSDDTFTDTAGKTWKMVDACIARDLGTLTGNTKMTRDSTAKFKCMMTLPDFANGGFWGSTYSLAGIQAQFQDAKDLGCNSVKFFLFGWHNPMPTEPQIQAFCGMVRSLGMKLFLGVANKATDWCGVNGTQRNAIVATIVPHIALWYQYGADIIAGFDISNEHNLGPDFTSPAWTSSGRIYADLAYLADKLREIAPTIPLSSSLYQGPSGFSDDNLRYFMQWQATLGFDYHDVHMYHGTGGSGAAGTIPDPAEVLSVENASWFIGRHLNGECGLDYAVNNDTVLTNWINNYAIPNAQRPKSLGVNFFSDRNYDTTHYGIMNNAAEKTAITAGVL